ncbi:MAG: hypothetical protein K0S67_2460 [Nitrososphaeraceae archaeon]|jgi:hypothetical protein|nr:hypothetical protein [Nitrososphaeraceae archaeon]MCD6038567.1 hypothetical protein [Nitrososphaeraceae archaeon]MDF2768526.1 hypothetical protein [Nitrososphaeraceae archaeon]
MDKLNGNTVNDISIPINVSTAYNTICALMLGHD